MDSLRSVLFPGRAYNLCTVIQKSIAPYRFYFHEPVAAEAGFAARLAYVRWLRDLGALAPESDRALAQRAGVGYEWLAKWKKRSDAPETRSPGKLLAKALDADPNWLLDAEGQPPQPDMWARWIGMHARARESRLRHPRRRRVVLYRERVKLVVAPHPTLAQLLPVLGAWTIIVDANASVIERTVGVAHEMAHLWLHHDPRFDRAETSVYDRSPAVWSVLEEAEADALAEMIVAGPAGYFPPRERYVKTYEPRPRVVLEARTDSGLCPRCGVRFGIDDDRVPRAIDGDVCAECAMLDLSTMEACGDVE